MTCIGFTPYIYNPFEETKIAHADSIVLPTGVSFLEAVLYHIRDITRLFLVSFWVEFKGSIVTYTMESLILAQDERWRRA